MILLLLGATVLNAADDPIEVRYRSTDSVYLSAGRVRGIEVGDRFAILRGGEEIARVEVAFVADHSASCRILDERQEVAAGDEARPQEQSSTASGEKVDGGTTPRAAEEAARNDDPARPAEVEAPAATAPEESPAGDASDEATPAGAAELAIDTRPVPPVHWKERKRAPAHTSVRGTMTVDWETFTDRADGEQFDYSRREAYLKLRVRDIGGLPYELRVRLRTQQNLRSQTDPASPTRSESRNRYYELSLTYDPPHGKYSYRVGRLSASPFVGIGYLDGVLGQMALSSIVEVGAFAGSGSNVEEFAPDVARPRYGLFTRFTSPTTDSSLPWEIIVAGVREHGEQGVSREFLTLQSRYSAKKWSIYQRAELDINSGWRAELAQKSSQLSNFSLTATGRFSRSARLSVSYDLFEQYRTEETRFLPEELFGGVQRQGIRANLQLGEPRGLSFSLNGGVRDQAGENGNTVSYGFGVRHGNVASWGLSLGLNLLGFRNDLSEGYTASLRATQRLRGDHQLTLTIGDRRSQSLMFSDEAVRSTQWVRLGGWFELPMSLFANVEYEAAMGDDLEGQRLSASLGYRF